MWKAMRHLLSRKGPLLCDPRNILTTLLFRKAVENKNYEQVGIPKPREIERITSNLNKQIQTLLDGATFTDSMIADKTVATSAF
eukprot:TRINITY_DN10046_c0_g1_i1.p1 TRINITY_DN10046_c0_g1~~TRINITY_DN10046_c0_g1_i1.p1  ORF type:complete len:84 (+),score=4.95 TRINITY_DN10046_c0_g1_i1:58-309(+)